MSKYKCWIGILLIGGCSCSLQRVRYSSPLEGGGAWGVIRNREGQPVAGARVHAYEVFPMEEDKEDVGEAPPDIETFLREELEVSPEAEKGPGTLEVDFRGPADYKSALTEQDGLYILRLPEGDFRLVARKRAPREAAPPGDIEVGPLTPEDYSSWISEPVKFGEDEQLKLDFVIQSLAKATPSFRGRYAIRAGNTAIKGVIRDASGAPISGLLVVANRRPKASRRPDFVSRPSAQDGSFTLHLPKGGQYYLGLMDELWGEHLPCRVEPGQTIEVNTGGIRERINIIRLEEDLP